MERPSRNLAPPRILPWRSWGDWQRVADVLLQEARSGDLAPSWVSTELQLWVARGRAPLAVHCTAQLRQLLERSLRVMGPDDEAALRLSLSMALVRLVNGFTDSGQGGAYARSVYEVASRLGLPRPLVDVRHESSHGSLPSLGLLRVCARQALQWLLDAYWRRQADHLALAPCSPDLLALIDSTSAEASEKPPEPPVIPDAVAAVPTLRTSAARRLLRRSSGGSGGAGGAAGSAADAAPIAIDAAAPAALLDPLGASGEPNPTPSDVPRPATTPDMTILARYAAAVADVVSRGGASPVLPPALTAIAGAAATAVAALPTAYEARMAAVLPLMSSSCPGAPYLAACGTPLLLEQCEAAAAQPLAFATILYAWLPLLLACQAAWPSFTSSIAAAAAGVVVWGVQQPTPPELLEGDERAPTASRRARLATAALSLLKLFVSERWSALCQHMQGAQQQQGEALEEPQQQQQQQIPGSLAPSAWLTCLPDLPTPAALAAAGAWRPAPPDVLAAAATLRRAPHARRPREGRRGGGSAATARVRRRGHGGAHHHGFEGAGVCLFLTLSGLAHDLRVLEALLGATRDEGAAEDSSLRADALSLCAACGVDLGAIATAVNRSILDVVPWPQPAQERPPPQAAAAGAADAPGPGAEGRGEEPAAGRGGQVPGRGGDGEAPLDLESLEALLALVPEARGPRV